MKTKKVSLLIDVPNIGYASYYGFRNRLKTKSGIPTSVLYGVLSRITTLTTTFTPKNIVFCFDSRKLHRKTLCPHYKGQRTHISEIREQINHTRKVLVRLGFQNVFKKKGYEADDLIAEVAQKTKNSVIISSDQDFYQCLSKACSIYDLRKKQLITEKSFVKKYGITPSQWIEVKAIAGCSSDNVKGIPGIGETRAIKYLKGLTFPQTKLIEQGQQTIDFNRKLVELPFSGILPIKIKTDKILISQVKKLFQKYEFYQFLQVSHMTKWKKLIRNLRN